MEITRLKEQEQFYKQYLKECKTNIQYCLDKDTMNMWYIEISYVESLLRNIKKHIDKLKEKEYY